MQSTALVEPGRIVLQERKLEPIPPGWVRIRVGAAGICGSDFYLAKNVRPGVDMIGHTLGHELAGTVEEVGAGVADIQPGQRVAVEPLINCGRCDPCLSGNYHLCDNLELIGVHYPGGYASYATAPARKLLPLPDAVSCAQASQLDGTAVVLHAIHLVQETEGATVAVLGDGFIGLMAVQLARLLDPGLIVAVGKHDFNLNVASQLGATHTVNLTRDEPLEVVADLTHGKGTSLIFESVGRNAAALAMAGRLAAKRGTIVALGMFHDTEPLPLRPFVVKELFTIGSFCYSRWQQESEYGQALGLVVDGTVQLDPLITHQIPLTSVAEAWHIASHKEGHRAIKVVLIP